LHKRPLEGDNEWPCSKRFASQCRVEGVQAVRYVPGHLKRKREVEVMDLEELSPKRRLIEREPSTPEPYDSHPPVEDQSPVVNPEEYPVIDLDLEVGTDNVPEVSTVDSHTTEHQPDSFVVSPAILRWIESLPPKWIQPKFREVPYGAIVPYQDPTEMVLQVLDPRKDKGKITNAKMVVED